MGILFEIFLIPSIHSFILQPGANMFTSYLILKKLHRKFPEEHILWVQAKTFVDQRVLEHMEIKRYQNMSR